jgi:flagellar hook assembly protein FlgD
VTLAIYDVAGRRVRMLVDGRMTEAGDHRIDWDGRSDAGSRLASGVYFARFVAEGQVSARKLIMLR